jgi:hypothetical protein
MGGLTFEAGTGVSEGLGVEISSYGAGGLGGLFPVGLEAVDDAGIIAAAGEVLELGLFEARGEPLVERVNDIGKCARGHEINVVGAGAGAIVSGRWDTVGTVGP